MMYIFYENKELYDFFLEDMDMLWFANPRL